jgi:hypothetical protein
MDEAIADSIQVNPGAFFLAFAATLALSRPIPR